MADLKIDKSRYTVDSLYQWDTNQELKIYGLSMLDPEIHFTNEAMGGSIVVDCTVDESGVISVKVPNSLLQYKYSIVAYIAGFEGDTFKTYHKVTIPVKARKRPGDYTLSLSDNEVYSFKSMSDRITNIEDEIQSEGSILYNYTLDADDVKLVEASGKKSIGEYIPLVSSSLKAVKGLSDKFKTMIDANTKLGETALSIAKGINSAKVFDTTADMETWLSDEANKGKCDVGNNLYIIDIDVPDWWIAEVLDTPDSETGYYYKIAQLEVQKVDLTDINNSIDTLEELPPRVETLENTISFANWNISNETYEKKEGLIATLPETLTKIRIASINDDLYVYGFNSSNTHKFYKYANGEWTTLATPSAKLENNNQRLLVYKDKIYYSSYLTSSQRDKIYCYDPSANTWSTVFEECIQVTHSGTRWGFIDTDGEYLYYYACVVGNNDYTMYAKIDSTFKIVTEGLLSNHSDAHAQYLVVKNSDEILYGYNVINTGNTYSRLLYMSNIKIEYNKCYKYGNVLKSQLGNVIKYKDNILLGDFEGYELYKFTNNNLEPFPTFEYSYGKVIAYSSYKDELIKVTDTEINTIKLYKEATSYVPKGSKMYLDNSSFVISDNLEKIDNVDNCYLVTADGEIKIGIYE